MEVIMQPLLLLVGVVVTLLASPPSTCAVDFIDTGDCEVSLALYIIYYWCRESVSTSTSIVLAIILFGT